MAEAMPDLFDLSEAMADDLSFMGGCEDALREVLGDLPLDPACDRKVQSLLEAMSRFRDGAERRALLIARMTCRPDL